MLWRNSGCGPKRLGGSVMVAGLIADRFTPKLLPSIGDGCYGFVIPVAGSLLESARVAEARVANLGDPISGNCWATWQATRMLRIEGMEGNPANVKADLLTIGDPYLPGGIHRCP
jgi:hypothetical protein